MEMSETMIDTEVKELEELVTTIRRDHKSLWHQRMPTSFEYTPLFAFPPILIRGFGAIRGV
jgi:hypothetical protein